MKVRHNFIIAIAAVMMLLIPSTQFFAEPSCVPRMTDSLSERRYNRLMKQVNMLRRITPERKLNSVVYQIEYEKYSMDYLLGLVKKGKRITALDNYDEIKNIEITYKTEIPELPNNIADIPNYFFAGCSLKNFCVPKNIKKIGKGAFCCDMELQEVTIPGSVKEIERGAFFYCDALEKVKLEEGLKSIAGKAFDRCEYLEEIEIPSTVESIGDNAFYGCIRLKKVILKNGLKSIGDNAFDCVSLEELVIPSTIEYVGLGQWNCKKLVLMDGIERVYENMTESCYDLEEIELPCSIKHIDDYAFSSCNHLKGVNLPENLTNIGTACFKRCLALKEVVIPDSVIEIGERAFAECDNLERVKIPKRFENRLGDIFNKCKSLKEIILYDKNNVETQIPTERINDIIGQELPKNQKYNFYNIERLVTIKKFEEKVDNEELSSEIYDLSDSTIDLSQGIVNTSTIENTDYEDIMMDELLKY